jgi:hypothetical protein
MKIHFHRVAASRDCQSPLSDGVSSVKTLENENEFFS